MTTPWKARLTSALAALLFGLPAFAEPVVAPGKKPGIATAWRGEGKRVVLELQAERDPVAVAEAITKAVPGVKVKVKGSDLEVSGLALDALLSALEKVEVEANLDDVNSMLAAMQAGGRDDDASGSSIRATQAADFSDVLGEPEGLVLGKVVDVRHAAFPQVVVTVEVARVPGGLKGVRRGASIQVLPRVKLKDGAPDPADKASTLNVGAWYVQPGDRVRIRLATKPGPGGVYDAVAFERRGGGADEAK